MRLRRPVPPAFWIGLLLVAMVGIIYARTAGFQFLSYDDTEYVAKNPVVRAGLTWAGVAWAFTTFWAANWHPLTWLSLMMDVSLFGPGPGPAHLVNATLHAANAVLLFLLLRSATGSFWRSALVAALFAVHPLRVESVAWVAERKDLLSAGFALLTLLAYLRYTRRPGRAALALAALCYALALMAKPMPVSLPILMLLLDRWPLGRAPSLAWRDLRPLLAEKVPFLLLAGASCVVTVIAQRRGGAVAALAALTFLERLCNALWAYARYLGLACWPLQLSPFYDFATRATLLRAAVPSAILLAGATWFAHAQRHRRPYLLFGWLWFLVSLVPVIGIVQVGGQALADRYTYLPMLGPTLVLVWGGAELAVRFAVPVRLRALAAGLVLGVLMVLSWVQTGFWRNTEILFRHALRVEPRSPVVLINLGLSFINQDRAMEALPLFQEAVRLKPTFPLARGVLAETYYCLGDYPKALHNYGLLLVLRPADPSGLLRCGELLARAGRLEESVTCFRAYLRTEPQRFRETLNPAAERAASQRARMTLALTLRKLGWHKETCTVLAESLKEDPGNPMILFNEGLALVAAGRAPEALDPLRQCARVMPNAPEVHFQLGLVLAQAGDAAGAREAFTRTLTLNPAHPGAAAELEKLPVRP